MLIALGGGARTEPALEALERLLRVLAAVDARGAEEHDGVLDVLRLEPAQRLEVLRQDADGSGLFALEELGILVGVRLWVHPSIIIPTRVHPRIRPQPGHQRPTRRRA